MSMAKISQVLIIENDSTTLERLTSLLQNEGFHVVGSKSTTDALEHISKRDFGVAVVSLPWSDISESKLLEHIRNSDDRVRVIIYANLSSFDALKNAMNLGAFAYVERRHDTAELLRHLHRACFEQVDRYAIDLERAVAARTEELARINDELEKFAGIVAHDLRSPLMTISAYCQLLDEEYGEKLEDVGGEYLVEIQGGVRRMARLIEDLLDYSRAARSPQVLKRLPLESAVKLAIANLDALIHQENAAIQVGSLPTVFGDEIQLAQLFQNLLGNAVKFCSDDQPIVCVSAIQDGEFWRVSVADNGIGIGKQHLDRIFQAFQRFHGDEYPGNGIGLAICKKIVERHGGKIWVESSVGQGSIFSFSIPLADQ